MTVIITIIIDQIIIRNRNAITMIEIAIGIISQAIGMAIAADRLIGMRMRIGIHIVFRVANTSPRACFLFVSLFFLPGPSRNEDRYYQNRYDPDPVSYYSRTDPNSPYYRGNGYDNRDPEYYYKMKGTGTGTTGYNDGE